MKPLVGITGRQRLAGSVRGMRSSVAASVMDLHFADYAEHVAAAGGLPVQLPQAISPFDAVDRLDALVLSGGADIDPRRYGRVPGPGLTAVEPARDAFELALIDAAWDARIPILAICRGAQLMAVARGGTLVTDLPEDDGEAHPGEHYPVGHRVHLVTCAEGSRAASLFGAELLVNTLHHQAVADPGEGLQVTGRAADGVVEVTEAVDRPVLAVQWHPERLRAPDPTFQWLVAQAGQVAACA